MCVCELLAQGCYPGCLQLLELLKILEIWNLKLYMEILDIFWNLVDAPVKFYS